MAIITLEGLRGTGKSYLINQLKEKYDNKMAYFKYPTEVAKDIISDMKFDMTSIKDVVKYNMIFINDFITSSEEIFEAKLDGKEVIIIDRYILSNLAHFKYDVYQMLNSTNEWDGMAKILYEMYDNQLVLKPDLIIHLIGDYKQPEGKFDDDLYKGKEEELKWFYDTELSNLKNKLNIPFHNVQSLKPNTFEAVDSIIKSYIPANTIE
jgi:thymidylate kinase